MNYHIGHLVLSSLCVEALLQPAKRTPPKTSRTKSSNTQRTENKTTDVAIHQHSRTLLKMDILMSETCWAHNKWNKIASDIKLVFHSSIISMMHGPINIRLMKILSVGAAMSMRTYGETDRYGECLFWTPSCITRMSVNQLPFIQLLFYCIIQVCGYMFQPLEVITIRWNIKFYVKKISYTNAK